MRNLSDALKALLATGLFIATDIYTITLIDATVLTFTSLDIDIIISGITYKSRSDLFTRSKIAWKLGTQVDSMDLTIMPNPTDLVKDLNMVAAFRMGYFDGATVQLDRVFMPTNAGSIWLATGNSALNVSTDYVIRNYFLGRFGDVEIGGTSINAPVNSMIELLAIQMPRNLYQPGCLHTLYDAACGVSRASYTSTFAAGSGGTLTAVPVPSTGQADDYYTYGVMAITSASRGVTVRRQIAAWLINTVIPVFPLPWLPIEGDVVLLTAGCDKTMVSCHDKFGHTDYGPYEGFPYIPAPETTI